MKQAGWPLLVKRAIDVSIGAAALSLSLPVTAAAGVAIRMTMGKPVFFSQLRPGLRGLPFRLYKLRTMTLGGGDDSLRLTPLGRWLRALSIDELPQLWNVVCGSMSLVGPRPLLMEYLPRYTPEQRRRHDVLPGITGWAQINGRNALSHEARFVLDLWYVDHWTLGFDLRILAITFWRVVSRSGISAQGHVTMPEFMGNVSNPESGQA